MSKAQIATFEELLDITEALLRPVVTALREVVFEVDADTCEVVRLGDRAATYGVGPRKMLDGYAYIMPHKRWVNLGFYQGAELDDPEGLLEGTGAKLRHVKVRSVDEARRAGVRALVEGALERRRASGR